MNCPRCHAADLETRELEPGLRAGQCGACHGHWIEAADYWSWISRHKEPLPEKALDAPAASVIVDAGRAILCPHCGHILIRRHVAVDMEFLIDHCGSCGAMWLDAGEWGTLKDRHLGDHLHEVFSEVWQARIVREEQERNRERVLNEKYGAETLAEIRRVRAWLADRSDRYDIHALLHPDAPL